MALALACTAHAAQGKTLPAVIADLALGRGVSSIASYVAITRVTHRQGLLIFRPFDVKPFQEGVPEGTALLLRNLRGEDIDWKRIEDNYIPEKNCGLCNKVRDNQQFTKWEFKHRDTISICIECMAAFKDDCDNWDHHFCETCQIVRPLEQFKIHQTHFFPPEEL